MSHIASQIILHPQLSQTIKLLSTTIGRDKTYRLVQYFARFLAWFLLSRDRKLSAARWNSLKNALANGRKMMRIGKPLEHLQAALRATQAPSLHQHPAELITTIGRQLGYAGFLTYDTLVWANWAKFINFTPERARQVNKTAMRFWFVGLVFGIAHGGMKISRLGKEAAKIKKSGGKFAEKDVGEEAEKKIKLKALHTERAAVSYQLIQDSLDIWIPATGAELVNVNDGVLGLIGIITSFMALRLQWAKAGKA